MSFTYIPIPLFSEEHFNHCIVVPFPEGGKIKDTMVIDKTAYILVEANANANVIQGHFHIVPVLGKLYADGYEYVGTYKIDDFMGQDALLTVIQITAGDFGIFSEEFIAIHGEEERDRIIAEHRGLKPAHEETEIKSQDLDFLPADGLGQIEDEDKLRNLWDFTTMGSDKTDDNENPETESETE